MLRINRLRIEIQTDNKTNGGVYGFDKRFFNGLNFIASNDNTSGKSSVIEAIYYCLGLEEIIGGRNNQVLTSAYKTQLKDGNDLWNVLESRAYLEISNGEEIITVFRTAEMDGRDPRLVTVYYSDYDSIKESVTKSEDMYLHDGGAATNEKGFHSFLESFLHIQLPLVHTLGKDHKLYLQTVFSCMFIEQKHGWSHLFSGMPYLGIRESKKRVVEFIIGLECYEINKQSENLKTIKKDIESKWKSIINDINQSANRENCAVSGLPMTPRIMGINDFPSISIYVYNNNKIDEVICRLRKEHDRIKERKPRIIDNFDELNSLLLETEETIRSYEEKLDECNSQLLISKGAIEQSNRVLDTVEKDLINNKDAAKLRRMGSTIGSQAFNDICPTCHQKLQDSMINQDITIPNMSIDENIRHLKAQKTLLEFNRDSHKNNVESITIVRNDIQARLVTLRRLAQTIRSDLFSTETEWSEAIIHKLVEIEFSIKKYEDLKEYVNQKVNAINCLSEQWKDYKEKLSKLPKKKISESDLFHMDVLKKYFTRNLREFNYKSVPKIDTVTIPIDTCLPMVDGFDMKFDSSASDNIRVIWAYTLALLQTSIDVGGNHPGLIIFDEPAQHSIVNEDMESLIQNVMNLGASAQVIFGITLNAAELKNVVLNLPKNSANVIEIKNRAFNIL